MLTLTQTCRCLFAKHIISMDLKVYKSWSIKFYNNSIYCKTFYKSLSIKCLILTNMLLSYETVKVWMESYLWNTASLPIHLDSSLHTNRSRGDNLQFGTVHNPAGNFSRSILLDKLIKWRSILVITSNIS